MKRYHTTSGSNPSQPEAEFFISGPQAEDQIPEGVRLLLAMSGITQVDVRFDHGQGPRIEVFRNMPEDKE